MNRLGGELGNEHLVVALSSYMLFFVVMKADDT
jgi:hypothetical protein